MRRRRVPKIQRASRVELQNFTMKALVEEIWRLRKIESRYERLRAADREAGIYRNSDLTVVGTQMALRFKE